VGDCGQEIWVTGVKGYIRMEYPHEVEIKVTDAKGEYTKHLEIHDTERDPEVVARKIVGKVVERFPGKVRPIEYDL